MNRNWWKFVKLYVSFRFFSFLLILPETEERKIRIDHNKFMQIQIKVESSKFTHVWRPSIQDNQIIFFNSY